MCDPERKSGMLLLSKSNPFVAHRTKERGKHNKRKAAHRGFFFFFLLFSNISYVEIFKEITGNLSIKVLGSQS